MPEMNEGDQPPRLRWIRAQRFRLTAQGREAENQWRMTVVAQQSGGRPAFDAARNQWASQFKVEADDGVYLGELTQPVRLEEVLKSVADMGTSREQVKQSLERLFTAGLMEPAAVA